MSIDLGGITIDYLLEQREFLLNGNTIMGGPIAPNTQVEDILTLIRKLEDEHQMPLEMNLRYEGDGRLMIFLEAIG